ncbi:MAG: SagB/ThcOx family dehydrogenase [Phycisphaerae bacterium]|nr:SagB/ThcOx family dehydrogenase [Phycisphaerae bacterium]
MNRRAFLKTMPAIAALAAADLDFAQEADLPSAVSQTSSSIGKLTPIELVKPSADGGKSVLAALWERKTNRSISDRPLSDQDLSNLLWAAFGANRPDGVRGKPGRTAATASNAQEIDIYAVLPAGIYRYDAVAHRLMPAVEGDHRGLVGRRRQGAMAAAPVILVYVADIGKYKSAPFQEPGLRDPEIQKSYYNVAIGLIAGNVYLFAASQGLAAWFHNCNKPALAEVLKLGPEQYVMYAQTVGHPA